MFGRWVGIYQWQFWAMSGINSCMTLWHLISVCVHCHVWLITVTSNTLYWAQLLITNRTVRHSCGDHHDGPVVLSSSCLLGFSCSCDLEASLMLMWSGVCRLWGVPQMGGSCHCAGSLGSTVHPSSLNSSSLRCSSPPTLLLFLLKPSPSPWPKTFTLTVTPVSSFSVWHYLYCWLNKDTVTINADY